MGKTNDEKKWIIYMYTFPNGKRYIGKTCKSLKDRQYGSKWKGYNRCPALWNAIQKYGVENIQQDILFESYMTDEYSDRLEMLCIALFKTNCVRYKSPSYGYNCNDGGGGTSGFHHSEETKRKISDKAKERLSIPENNPNYGKHLPEETRKKISESHKGMFSGKNNPNYGKPCSEETKMKIRNANSGKFCGKNSPNARAILCIELNRVWKCIKDAADELNINYGKISSTCSGTRKMAGGYHWIYLDDFSIENIKNILSNKINFRDVPVICTDMDILFNNIADASKFANIDSSCIKRCIYDNGKTAGGYHWRKATEEEWLAHRLQLADEIISNLFRNEELMNEVNKL